MGKLTLDNIKAFAQGNARLLGDRLNLLEPHIKEQVAYRAAICHESCFIGANERCDWCGCSLPGKWYATKSCNEGSKFPDLMDKDNWEKYKLENGIK
jgi:hypothetical protein